MVLISEFMASNGFSLDDEDGDNSDWIEIVNATGSPVSVGGMFLTDDALNLPKWGIPAGLVLQPNEFLVVFASGKDRRTLGQELHTNFVLAAGGEYLALVASNGATITQEFSPQFPGQKSDISYGFDALYLTASTPGEVNAGPGVTGFVADTKFSIDRGFYTSPITVEITTASPGAMIVYTTDSSTPTLSNGTLVPGPLALVNIAATMVLRAAAFKDDLAPTNVDTHTYVFAADVVTPVRQSERLRVCELEQSHSIAQRGLWDGSECDRRRALQPRGSDQRLAKFAHDLDCHRCSATLRPTSG